MNYSFINIGTDTSTLVVTSTFNLKLLTASKAAASFDRRRKAASRPLGCDERAYLFTSSTETEFSQKPLLKVNTDPPNIISIARGPAEDSSDEDVPVVVLKPVQNVLLRSNINRIIYGSSSRNKEEEPRVLKIVKSRKKIVEKCVLANPCLRKLM
ncbi:hypothetical protein EVAR_44893_1 [Eumeta japonica]|uniref:Uncharacterized protein n=1 Tax=Eumeta variegata TaxID=151549 RepID=A0A4C1XLB7_EUMVA|nr:hypothetical protein EVAR_44893_1 [Eumeta japonica]